MRTPVISIFSLITFYTKAKKSIKKMIDPACHCDQLNIHDYYCDEEQIGI